MDTPDVGDLSDRALSHRVQRPKADFRGRSTTIDPSGFHAVQKLFIRIQKTRNHLQVVQKQSDIRVEQRTGQGTRILASGGRRTTRRRPGSCNRRRHCQEISWTTAASHADCNRQFSDQSGAVSSSGRLQDGSNQSDQD